MTQYHVTLNGQGYVLDLEKYQKRPRAPFAGKVAGGALSLDDLRGPEQLLRLTDWSGGEGEVQSAAGSKLYRSGAGLDVFTASGAVQLGPNAPQLAATAEILLGPMCVYGSNIYVGSGSGQVYKWDGTTWSTAFVVGGVVTALEVFQNRLYIGNSVTGALNKWDGATLTLAATAAGSIWTLRTHYRQALQYLYLGVASVGVNGIGRIYYFDGAAISAAQYDPEEAFPLTSFVMGGRCYFAVSDVGSRRWSLYSVDDSGSGGVWRLHQRVPTGLPVSSAVLGGVAYLGDFESGRIWAWDGTRVYVVRELATVGGPYAGSLYGLAAWRGALWVGIQQGGGVGLLRYDGASWSRPVSGLTGTDIRGLGAFGDRLVVGCATSGASRSFAVRTDQFQASGQLESGLLDVGLPGTSKLLRSVTIVTSALVSPQSVQVEYRLEDTGGYVSLGTLSTVGATTATYAFPASVTARQVSFRVTLSGTGGASTSPVLYELVLRYVPRPAVAREWDLAVVLEGTGELPLVTLDGSPEPLTGAQLTSAVWSAAGSAPPVTFVDLDGTSYQVYVDDVREAVSKISQRRGYQRLGLVKLVEAA